jgi:hypothetical protein
MQGSDEVERVEGASEPNGYGIDSSAHDVVSGDHQVDFKSRRREDASLAVRCLMVGGLPELGPLGAVVQTPGGISMFYDVGQGQGWQRNIVMDESPICLPVSASDTATRAGTGRAIRW